jgi:predicted SAM-dependent methyltransferase
MKRNLCSICNSLLKNIYLLDKHPIKLCCTDSPIKDFSTLSLSQCIACNTIQLDELIPLEILYSDSHNYSSYGKIWENYFKIFINKLNPIIQDKNILEIGCPSGKIVSNVNSYNKWIIVEPNKNKKIVFKEDIIFIEKFFDSEFYINLDIDIIIHSHLLEHIYYPNEFLKKCYNLLKPDGIMMFGVPNMNYFTENYVAPFLGIFFEHTIFLNKDNICYLLKKNSFELIEITDYENHSTIYYCKKIQQIQQVQQIQQIQNYYVSFINSVNFYKLFINKCNAIINNTEKNVYIFGASYNTQYLLSLGINSNKIKGILDNSIEKQNKYFYGYDIYIYSPEILKNDKECIIIVKNGCYTNEIIEQILNINKNINIIF